MKEKLNQAMNWVRGHRKRAAGILIAFLLVIGAGIFGIVGVNSVNRAEAENKKTEGIKTAKEDTKKETKKKEEKKETEEKKEDQEEKKEETESKEKEVAGKQETQEAGTTPQSTGTAPAPASGGNKTATSESKHEHSYNTPVYGTEQKWVVDQAAWTETVNEPIYEMQIVWYCNECGADISSDPEGHVDQTMHSGYHNDWIQVQTGINTYTVDHPEQGHWESYSVVTGYQCSCGVVR